MLGHFLLAAVLGAAVGIERELAAKPAGLRTQMIVASASALLVSLGFAVLESSQAEAARDVLRVDPLRTIEAVVTGVSFLGAGTIVRGGKDVEGLTTAAALLLSASIGIAVAASHYALAIGVTLAALLVLHGLGRLEAAIRARK